MRGNKLGILPVCFAIVFFAACGTGQQAENLPMEMPTQSMAPTNTSTPTPSLTPTNTPMPTPSPTPTNTPTPTPSPAPTNTPTPTPSPTPTNTPTPTPSPTPTSTPTPTPHIHEYKGKVTKDATFEKDGIKTYTCSCGESYTEKIPAIGYTYTDMELDMYAESTVNVRSLPSTDGRKLGALNEAEKVVVTGKCNEVNWYRIVYKGETGYVSASYLTDKNPLPSDDELRTVTSLYDIPVYGVLTNENSDAYNELKNEFKEGTIEKVKYVCSTGEVFRIWNARLEDRRVEGTQTYYYWFVAPQGKTFSSGYRYCNWSGSQVEWLEKTAILQSTHFNTDFSEARVGYVNPLPKYPVYSDAAECPVELHKIVREGDIIYFWYESEDRDYLCGGGNCTWCKLWEEAEKQARDTFGFDVFWTQGDGPIIWNGKYYYRSVFVGYD